VRTYGWFENADSVFITMEFFPLGDLQHFMVTWPPFPEEATRQIVRQLIEGVNFMHESGFAHRDLKPGVSYLFLLSHIVRSSLNRLQNILVKSHSPGWLVKIADFGISKRAQEGGTDLRTMHIGTFGYMAPEVLGFFSGNDPAVAYSVSIDIWAIGVISIELLLKQHPFSNVSDLVTYVHGTKQLDLVGVTGMNLSNTCRDFVSALLAPNPATRPTAGAASKHPWIAAGIPSADTEES
jgi:serine/threonine protein kinase